MNLGVTGVGHVGSAFVGAEGGHDITAHGVGGEVENVAITSGGEDDCIRGVRGDLARYQITNDDALGLTINEHNVHHFSAGVHFNATFGNFLL